MAINRRAFLSGRLAASEAHISSLVVHCRPEQVATVAENIGALPDAEVPRYSEEGKLVVLLEAHSESAIMHCIREIENLPGVISTALVYHQIDNETEATS